MLYNQFSLYIHIPFCISKCAYCDFFSKPQKGITDEYIEALIKEIYFYQKKYSIQNWKTVYIGGGTPSLLTQKQLTRLLENIQVDLNKPETEITIEVNPDDITEEFLSFLSETKINRLSCGIQSMNQECLSFVNRRADFNQNNKALELINKFWKKNFSVDLICGLPFETENSFRDGLDTVLSYNPYHISMYSLTVEDETPLGKLINSKNIEYNYDFADDLWIKNRDYLESKGYFQYEVSNFSKIGFESKHNLTYWNHENYIGCGSGASSTVYNEDSTGLRWMNSINIQNYIDFWKNNSFENQIVFSNFPLDSEIIDIKTSEFEYFMMGLRKLSGISEIDFIKKFNKSLPDYFCEISEKYRKRNYLEIDTEIKNEKEFRIYKLNKEGILFLNSFLEELLKTE